MSRMFEQLEGRRFLSASPASVGILAEGPPAATVSLPTITPLATLKGDTLVARHGLSISEGPNGGLTLSRGVLTADLTAAQASQIQTIQLNGSLDISGAVADG